MTQANEPYVTTHLKHAAAVYVTNSRLLWEIVPLSEGKSEFVFYNEDSQADKIIEEFDRGLLRGAYRDYAEAYIALKNKAKKLNRQS